MSRTCCTASAPHRAVDAEDRQRRYELGHQWGSKCALQQPGKRRWSKAFDPRQSCSIFEHERAPINSLACEPVAHCALRALLVCEAAARVAAQCQKELPRHHIIAVLVDVANQLR